MPLDASFVQVAPAVEDSEQAPVVDETPDATPESQPDQPDEVRDVLNGMFSLFEKQKSITGEPLSAAKADDGTVQPAKTAPAPKLPRAKPKDDPKSLFDKIFKPKNRQEKKEKKEIPVGFLKSC